MPTDIELRALLYDALALDEDVYTAHVSDPNAYLAKARNTIVSSLCEPFTVTATVMPPAFPDHQEGEVLSGYCLAKKDGYWLVYSHVENRFYCFWGSDPDDLGAHGIYGSPLACWLA